MTTWLGGQNATPNNPRTMGVVNMITVPSTQEAEDRGSLEAKEFRASLGNTARHCSVSFASREFILSELNVSLRKANGARFLSFMAPTLYR